MSRTTFFDGCGCVEHDLTVKDASAVRFFSSCGDHFDPSDFMRLRHRSEVA